MNLIQALDIVNDCARTKKLMGMNAVYPYKEFQFVDALLALREEVQAQLVKIKQLEAQLRASNARAAKNA
jgi:hypothetical protein